MFHHDEAISGWYICLARNGFAPVRIQSESEELISKMLTKLTEGENFLLSKPNPPNKRNVYIKKNKKTIK